MASSIFQNFVMVPAPLMLSAALALITGGLALIASSYPSRQELVARRVDAVRAITAAAAGPTRGARPAADFLFRLPVRGMSVSSQREAIARFSKLGVPANRALRYFAMTRLILAATLGAAALIWAIPLDAFQASRLIPFALAAITAIIGWLLPMILADYGVRQRMKAVKSGLPDALELLVVCVEAGLSLEDGLDRVVREMARSQPALADELRLTLADLKILPSRDQALLNLADRVDLPNVRAVVTTLIQTLRYGTPLAHSLRVVAAEMRNDYLVELEERANRLPAYLTLPVIVFLMPAIFLIVGGPAALGLLDAFRR